MDYWWWITIYMIFVCVDVTFSWLHLNTQLFIFFGCPILFSKPFFSSSGNNEYEKSQDSERWAPTVYYKYTRNLLKYWTNTTANNIYFLYFFLPYHHWKKLASHEMNFTQRGKVNNNKFHFQFGMQNHAQI